MDADGRAGLRGGAQRAGDGAVVRVRRAAGRVVGAGTRPAPRWVAALAIEQGIVEHEVAAHAGQAGASQRVAARRCGCGFRIASCA